MSNNPHPASGNGDVIERVALEMVRATAEYYGDPQPHNPDLTLTKFIAKRALEAAGLLKLSEGSGEYVLMPRVATDEMAAVFAGVENESFEAIWVELVNLFARCASSLSEGSGDGKMRGALERIVKLFVPAFGGKVSGLDGGTRVDDIYKIAVEALATPAPSPIDAAGMLAIEMAILVAWMRGHASARACSIADNEVERYRGTHVWNLAANYAKRNMEILPLATPAREIDREKIATAFAKDFPAVLAQYSQYKITDWFLNLIGGRHV